MTARPSDMADFTKGLHYFVCSEAVKKSKLFLLFHPASEANLVHPVKQHLKLNCKLEFGAEGDVGSG